MKLGESLARNLTTVRSLWYGMAGAAMAVFLLRLLLEFASWLHWSVGAVLAGVVGIGAAWLSLVAKAQLRRGASDTALALLFYGLFTIAVVGAWVSYMLHTLSISAYVVPANFSAGTFVDWYFYTLIDLIPGIDVWGTLHVDPPIEATDKVGGLPLLLFKLFVVLLFFDAVRTWLKARDTVHDSGAPSDDG